MTTRRVFHYSDREYVDGQTISSSGDHISRLTPEQRKIELLIRDRLPNGHALRSGSLYVWLSEELAKRLWTRGSKKYLYELEIDEKDILLRGDLNCFSAAVDTIKLSQDPQPAVRAYCDGKNMGHPYTEERVEALVRQARVIRKIGEK